MENPIQVDLGRIAQDLQIRRVQVESVVQLLDEGNTVPFITRYRKERTGGLNEVVIREIQVRVGRLRELAERKETILKSIEGQGKLTDELAAAIRSADNPKRLEDLYLPYKPKKKTKASDAREKGLEPLALRIWNRDETLIELNAAATELFNPEKEVDTVEKVLEGVGFILAEAISELANIRDAVRRVVWKTGKIVTSKSEIPEGEGLEYRDYFNYSEPIANIPPHRVLAINRGDKEGPLKVKLEVVRPELEAACFGQLPLEGHPQGDFFRAAAVDALDRLLLPSMEREVRRDLTETAERHAVDVFARNLRSLLLQPPIPKQVVLAIDPGLKSGCKIAVLDGNGVLLEHGVIHPHAPQNRRHEAKVYLKDLVGKHQVGVVAIGNGTACRETEELIAEIIAEGTFFHTNPGVEAMPAGAAAPIEAPTESSSHGEVTAHEEAPAGSSNHGHVAAHEEAPSESGSNLPPIDDIPPISGGAPSEGEEAEHVPAPEVTEAPAPVAEETPAAAEAATEPAPAAETPAAEATSTEAVPSEAASPAADASVKAPGEKPQGGGRPPKQKGEPRPQKPKGPPPPPKPHTADGQLSQLAYVIVNEAGASVYSTSTVGREEFPEFDATLRGTVSIGRRLQDPLAELVKIEPQNIGVGLYQHDVNPKQLKESLEAVISSCVNFVGVDLNTASVPLLRHVSGLNQLTARRIVDRRSEKGPFTKREELQEIEGIGPITYTQSAGFLKLPGGENPLDKTWVHPESYAQALKALENLGFGVDVINDRDRMPSLHEKMNAVELPTLARELEVGKPTLHDIFEALARPDRDPRDDLPKPIFKKGVLKLEDLSAGMELKGTVLNVVDFGAFIDIGLKDSGLVHISQLANRYIKSPHDVVSVGDVVSVWVIGVDNERKRVSLTMVKPGTERPRTERGAGGGGGGRGRGQGQGQGQPQGDRRGQGGQGQGGGRPPRSTQAPSPQLQAPPAGTNPPQGGEGQGQQGQAGGQGNMRRPGPPDRNQGRGPGGGQGGGGGQRFGQGGGGRGPGGGGRGPGGSGGGRFERAQAPRPATPLPTKPSKPAPPPPPLSKEALQGGVPLRSFGQLKQLWQAKVDEPDAPGAPTDAQPPVTEAPAPPAPETPPTSE
jgi:uncharacterized protein